MTAHFIEMRGLAGEVTASDIKEELQHFVGWSEQGEDKRDRYEDSPTTEITIQNVRALSERRLKAIELAPGDESAREYRYFRDLHAVIEQAAAEERELNSLFTK